MIAATALGAERPIGPDVHPSSMMFISSSNEYPF